MGDKIRNIPEQKLKAFSIGMMGKRSLSKKELEQQRKREEERATAHVFEEFVATFQENPIRGSNRVWVKAGTYDAGARKEDRKDKGKLYKPQSRIQPQELLSSAEKAKLPSHKKPERYGKRKQPTKSKFEAFKEELRQIKEERDDPTSTNLYVGNLNPKITQQLLTEKFGRFGPLASIRILWPRSEEEKSRERTSGFVAYMSRKDGERALRNLNGKEILGYEMKLSWGKPVIIPPRPFYVPPSLLELSFPPPPSGLPFNAQPAARDKDVLPKSTEELNEILSRSVVKVVIPTDRNLIMLIHKMVEFVVREGPMFEAMIMNREIQNPNYRFLFENQSPAHIYYRWKLYSIMYSSDPHEEWSTKEFRLFKNGSIWKPPVLNKYTSGMPEELVMDDDYKESTLSNAQRDRLEDLIRGLTPERAKIGEAMVFCIEHSDASDEIVDCITESLSNITTIITKKIARLYLVADILHNCGVKVNNASSYRKAFESKLVEITEQLKKAYDKLGGRLQAEGCKLRVLRVFQALGDSIYPKEYVTKLRTVFLGNIEQGLDLEASSEAMMDIDGDPLQDQVETDDDDDVPLDGATLLKSVRKRLNTSPPPIDDIDGEEIIENANYIVIPGKTSTPVSGFITSKWETVDPDQVEAQAMTTSKWDMLGSSEDPIQHGSIDDNQDPVDYSDLRNITEERRNNLREIELKVVQYQDELESGHRTLKAGWTLPQQVKHYRRKLLKKYEKERKEKEAKSEGHKRDYDKSERKEATETSEDEASYKEVKSRKSKKARSSSSGSTTKLGSKSRSPSRKKAYRAPSPPSPLYDRYHSSPSRSRKSKNRSPSPLSSSSDKYASPTRVSKSRRSPYSSSKGKCRTSSPRNRRSLSPKTRRGSTSPSYMPRYHSPEPTRKRRHKHNY